MIFAKQFQTNKTNKMKQVKFLVSAAIVAVLLLGQQSFAAVQKDAKEKKEKAETKATAAKKETKKEAGEKK